MLAAALVLGACGTNLSGEPDIVWEAEVQTLPTVSPTALAAEPTPDAGPEATAPPLAGDGAGSSTGGSTGDDAADSVAGVDLAAADYDAGFNLFLEHCTSCHGATDGTGPGLGTMYREVGDRMAGVSAADYVYQSIVEPGAYVVEGFADVMPATYGTEFTPQEVADLVKFVVEFDASAMMGSADEGGEPDGGAAASGAMPGDTGGVQDGGQVDDGTADDGTTAASTAPTGETFEVRGQLIAGSSDAKPIPPGVPLELYEFNETVGVVSRHETVSGEDNTFLFEEVPHDPTMLYAILADYDNVLQIDPDTFFQVENGDTSVTQDITLYDRTTDPTTVAITWAEMVVNFAPIEQFGIEVTITMEMINTGDKIVTLDETYIDDDGVERYVAAAFELPPGAFHIQPMQSSGSSRYFVDAEDGVPVLKDTQEFFPGQVHNVSLVYLLPYDTEAVIDQAFGYQVIDAWVLIPNDTVQFASTQFDTEGFWCCRVEGGNMRITELAADESVNPEKDFTLVKSHSLLNPTEAGDRLVFELIGRPTRTIDLLSGNPARVTAGDDDTGLLPLVISGAGLLLITMAGVMWWRQRGTAALAPGAGAARDDWRPSNPNDREALLHALATLDDAYDAGLIDDDVYEERRAILSDLLLPLLDEED